MPENKQIAILDASARVFAKKGYFQAGINEICKAASISNGALCKYFENKEGLFVTVAHQTMVLLESAAKLMAAGEFDTWDRLQRILEAVEPFTSAYRDYFLVYMELGAPCMDVFASELSDIFEGWSFAFCHKMIEEARSRGDVREGISTETAAFFSITT